MNKKLNHSLALGILLIGILFSSISEGFSQTTNYTWNNSTNLWSEFTAWTPTGGPQLGSATFNTTNPTTLVVTTNNNTNVAIFANVGAGNNTVLLASGRTVLGLVFTNDANAYTFAPQSGTKQIDIMNGVGLQNLSGKNQTFNLAIANSTGNGLWSNSVGSTTTFNNGLNLTTSSSSQNRTLTLGGAGTWNVASAIANGGSATNGAVTVTATGTTTLSGNNTYDGLTTMNAAGGTLTLSGNNSGAAGGVTLTAGTLNINNNNALGTGNLAFGGSTINNTSGSAVTNAGNNAWTWNSTTRMNFGTATNTAANNLDLGTGNVTLSGSRGINLFGTDTKLTIGNLLNGGGGTFTVVENGANNTLEMRGLSLSTSATPTTLNLAGTANIRVTGAVVSGTVAGNSLNVANTGTTTLSGANTYTGLTTMDAAGGSLTLSGNNSAASGGVRVKAGTVNVNSANALGTGTLTLDGSSAAINNTSGAAVTNLGNNAVVWDGSSTNGFTFGTSASTSANSNLNLGTGTVTAATSRIMTFAGSGTTLTMGTLDSTTTSASDITFTINGANNTLVLGGYKIRSGISATAPAARSDSLAGSANLTINGVIENGNAYANNLKIKGTGTTTFSGANTYTGGTDIFTGATLLYGADNVTADAGGQMAVSGTLDIASYNDSVSSVKVENGGLLRGTTGVLTAGSFDITGANTVSANLGGSSATLTKGMSNTVSILSGNNTYGGYTTVSGGTLKLGSSTALGTTANATGVGTTGFLDLNGQTGVAEALNYTGTGGLLNSAAGTTAIVSGAVDIGAGMTVETVGDITLSGQLTGSVSKNLTKSGAGTLKFTASNSTFTGTNTVSAGTLLVDTGASVASSKSIVNGGLLMVNGTAGSVSVNAGGSLKGSGTVGALTLASGAFLTPGNSPGTLNATSASLLAGSTYNWEINNAASSASAGTNWDLLNVTNELDLSTLTTSNKLNLVLKSLESSGLAAGNLSNFIVGTDYSWVFAQAGSINNAAFTNGAWVTDYFNIDTTAFNNDVLPASYFKVVVGTDSVSNLRTLSLTTIPEPSTGSMFGLGLAGLVVTRLLRRKSS